MKRLSIKHIFFFLLLFSATASLEAGIPEAFYNVKNFGAAGDGKHVDSDAINRAIDSASANGGGTVFFPAGKYLSFSIRLKSNICLYFDQGSVLVAANPTETNGIYDAPEPNVWGDSLKYQDFGHSHWHNSLIWGENIHDVSILGPGLIWGKGLARSTNDSKGSADKTISLKWCRNVNIRDVSILHGGWFCILATGVDNFTIDNVKMDTNRDGMDIDCCINVRISNCSVNSPFDDGICLKSSYGLGVARSTENVTITNCQVSGYDEGSFLDGSFKREKTYGKNGPTGRIKFGTESNGGFKNITISNCVFDYCRGLALETVDGALLEDVTISNITMRDVVNAPLFLRLGARMRGPANTFVGELRRVNISNIVVYNADPRYASIISGIPGHPLKDIRLDNIRIYYQGGGTKDQSLREVPEYENDYPEPYRFGEIPAYGFFVRHVSGIQFNNIETQYLREDARSPFMLTDVKDAEFRFVKAQKADGVPSMVLTKVDRLTLQQSMGNLLKVYKHVDLLTIK